MLLSILNFFILLLMFSSFPLPFSPYPHPPNMFLCIWGRISQMYVPCSGKNLGFARFFHAKIRDKRHTHWRTASSRATVPSEQGDGKVSLQILGMTQAEEKSLNVDCQQHWSPPTSAFCFPSLQICLCAKTDSQRLRGSKIRMAGFNENHSGDGRLNVSYQSLTCSLPCCR